MTDLRLIALDLSLAATGIAWTHDHTGKPGVGCRTVHTARTKHGATDMDHRRVATVLGDVAAAVQCKPDLVVIEWLPLFAATGDASLRLAELHGVIKHWLFTRRPSIPYVDVQPPQLKIWATGSAASRGDGQVTKVGVREAITATYGGLCHIEDSDQADALGLLSMACAAYGQPLAPQRLPQHRRALDAVRWPTLATEAGPVVPVISSGTGGAAAEGRRPSRPRGAR